MEGPSALGQLAWFLIITLIYGYLDYGLQTANEDNKNANMIFIYKSAYFLLAVIGQFFITVSVSAVVCGTPQYYTALFATAFPWIFIFGTMVGLLGTFPGWVMPFSNTFGYMVANGMGLAKTANEIFQKPDPSKSDQDETMAKALSYIYTDKATLINNITPENFNKFWETSRSLRADGTSTLEMKNKFKNYVILKHQVGTLTWYLLTGALVVSVSYNYIINSPCATTVDQISDEAERAKELKERAIGPTMKYISGE